MIRCCVIKPRLLTNLLLLMCSRWRICGLISCGCRMLLQAVIRMSKLPFLLIISSRGVMGTVLADSFMSQTACISVSECLSGKQPLLQICCPCFPEGIGNDWGSVLYPSRTIHFTGWWRDVLLANGGSTLCWQCYGRCLQFWVHPLNQ